MVAQSRLCGENATGSSVGFRGDGFKLGGGRCDITEWLAGAFDRNDPQTGSPLGLGSGSGLYLCESGNGSGSGHPVASGIGKLRGGCCLRNAEQKAVHSAKPGRAVAVVSGDAL